MLKHQFEMNIFKTLRGYALPNASLYYKLKGWNDLISMDLNESSMTCYPNGFNGISFGDRLNGVIYSTLYYLHRKMFVEMVRSDVLPIPGVNVEYWHMVIDNAIKAMNYPTKTDCIYEHLIKDLFCAVYNGIEWDCFMSTMIGSQIDDDITLALIDKMSKIKNNSDVYEERDLLAEEHELLKNSKFIKLGLFDFVSPTRIDWYNEQPEIGKIYSPAFTMAWDKNHKYKTGDIINIDTTKISCSSNNLCLILE